VSFVVYCLVTEYLVGKFMIYECMNLVLTLSSLVVQ